jgi:hypothetical protein
MAPTNADPLNKIEELKEMIWQMHEGKIQEMI